MNREIKFRCWGKNSKEYLGDNRSGFNMEELSRLAGQFKVWELEQYTGLKGKNGVEIYEGDVVKGEMGIFEVKWYDLVAQFAFKPNLLMDYHPSFNSEQLKDMEVIGTIHENPELLEGEE